MKHIFPLLLASLLLTSCASVTIIDPNADNKAEILASERGGLSASQTNTQGNMRATLEYLNNKLKYGEKVYYSTTFSKFVHARFSDKFVLFSLDELNMQEASIIRQAGGNKKNRGENKVLIPAKNRSVGFETYLGSGKQGHDEFVILNTEDASDTIKIKQAFDLMTGSTSTQ